MSVLQLVRCVDPSTAYRIYPIWVIDATSYFVTVLIVTSLSTVIYLSLAAVYKYTRTKMPKMISNIFPMIILILSLMSLFCVISHSFTDREVITYVPVLLTTSVGLLSLEVLYEIASYQLGQLVQVVQKNLKELNSVSSSSAFTSSLKRLKKVQWISRVIVLVSCVLGPILAAQAISTDRLNSQEVPNPNVYNGSFMAFMYVQVRKSNSSLNWER